MRRALAAGLAGLLALPANADSIIISGQPITRFQNAAIGEQTQELIFRGGLDLQSQSDIFGGLSGLGFVDSASRVVMVSDRGHFFSGQLIYDNAGAPLSLVGVEGTPIQNSKGNDLPSNFSRDAEALAVVAREGNAVAVRVGFENLTRVADFSLTDGRPAGRARDVSIPDWLNRNRTNESIEAVCIAPPTSPIAGSTVLLTEGMRTNDGAHAGFLLGRADRGAISYVAGDQTAPTDCAFLPNGDLLVLERGVVLVNFAARVVVVPAEAVRPGARMEGRVLYEGTGGDLDNMEGIAVHSGPNGETRITLISDNNFNDWERSLLLEFALAP